MSHSFHNIGPHPDTEPPTIFLPGWGFDGRIVRLLKPSPSWIYPQTILDPETITQDVLHLLVANNIKKVRLIGWSMGAMLGLEFAAKHGGFIDSMVLVSLRAHWPGHEIEEIRSDFSRNPESFLKGFYRKCFLGDKKAYRNFCATLEPSYLAGLNKYKERLHRGLNFLATFTIPSALPDVPITLLHGKQDVIAPVTGMPALPGADVEVVDNAGHSVFLHEDSSLQQAIKKQAIRVKFSRAADSYDRYATVQAEVAGRLAAKLPPAHKKPVIKTILEIGCGTGNFTSLLASRFPAANIIALDFSPEMIANARHKLQKSNIKFICAEGERFLKETPEKSFDLVVSNGSLQWFSNTEQTLHHIARTLTPGGSMSCSIFGPQSLQELGKGLQAVQPHAENLAAQAFPRRKRLQNVLHNSFEGGTVEEELIVKEYQSAYDLLLHIKKTGTTGWRQKVQHPLTPSRVKQLDAWFAGTYGACKVTYQVFFLQGNR